MNQEIIDFILTVTNQGLLLVLVICAPPIVGSMIVGLSVSLFQAVTQIQEQTLTFVPKMIVIFGSLAILGPWFGVILDRYAKLCFEGFPRYLF